LRAALTIGSGKFCAVAAAPKHAITATVKYDLFFLTVMIASLIFEFGWELGSIDFQRSV
jgi:uncharacterized membrane protein YedE/YeeE